MPGASRQERERRTYQMSDFAAALGVRSIACHSGSSPKIPPPRLHCGTRPSPAHRRPCRATEQTFALETGQEPAASLLQFLNAVDRPNAGINFDPANMILYGTGDPIEALGCARSAGSCPSTAKMGIGPRKSPGALGKERPLGAGLGGHAALSRKLKEAGFRGPLNVERETENQQERMIDIAMGVQLLKRLTEGGLMRAAASP